MKSIIEIALKAVLIYVTLYIAGEQPNILNVSLLLIVFQLVDIESKLDELI